MKQVAFVATEKTVASTFMGPMDILQQAGRLYNRIFGIPENPLFDVKLATVSGRAFETSSGIRVMPHCGIHDIDSCDLIVIASLGHVTKTLPGHKDTTAWLRHHHQMGTPIATVCTGAFLLAETGLLNGKTATTHWGFAALFEKMYPEVVLKPERMITDEGNLFCSGGFNAGIDLSIYLIEKLYGRKIAMQCAKTVIHDKGRHYQSPYCIMGAYKGHNDEKVRRIQSWIENHYTKKISCPDLAKRFGMSCRTFERRFKAATGDTPLLYLQRVRVEGAKKFLEETRQTFDEITIKVGYEDAGSFRKVFVRLTGLRPKAYQLKFYTRSRG